MLSMIQTALRANIADSAERVGPFLVIFNDHNDNPFFSCGCPGRLLSPQVQRSPIW